MLVNMSCFRGNGLFAGQVWQQRGLILVLCGLIVPGSLFGQSGNDATPLVFQNGNTIDVSSVYPYAQQNGYPIISNPIEVLGSGGTLTNSKIQQLEFGGAITGTGTLTVNTNDPGYYLILQSGFSPVNQTIVSCGLTMESGGLITENLRAAIVAGPLSITGTNVCLGGKFTFTSNSINGTNTSALNPDVPAFGEGATLIFSGAGPGFNFASSIGSDNFLILNNTSGTQTFGGAIAGNVYRIGMGGTSTFTQALGASLQVFGGTAILSGANGIVTNANAANTRLELNGGSLVLDNTSANNNNRIHPTFLNFNGGNLSLRGVNGGISNQTIDFPRGSGETTGPVMNLGQNAIQVQAGTGTGSMAMFTFGGLATSYDGSLDFQGLGANAQVFINSMIAGPMEPWATFNGIDFAGYDTTAGVVQLSATGRPSQVSSGTAGSYVLGTSAQTALTGNVSVNGVTMNTGAALDLGGNTLKLGAWIQNTSAATISNGTLMDAGLFENDHYFGDIVFTTNADLIVSTGFVAGAILKNGPGTLTLTGSAYGTQALSTGFPTLLVNQGTLALNLTVPLETGLGSNISAKPIVVGKSGGAAGTAILSLLADNQFVTLSSTGPLVSMQILPAGQFNLNGHMATLNLLEVDGGLVNLGGGMLTASNIQATPTGAGGTVSGGTLVLIGTTPTISVANDYPYSDYLAPDEGLVIQSQINASAPLTKTGSGTLALAAAASAFGNGSVGLIVSQGTLALQNSGATGSANQQIQLANGTCLQADTALSVTNPVTANGTVGLAGSALTLSGGLTQSAHGELDVANTTTISGYSNNLASPQGSAMDGKLGVGTLVLSGQATGTATGVFSLDAGALAFDTDTPLPMGMTLQVTAGTLEAVNNPHTVANPLNIVGDATFAGTEPLTFSAVSGNVLSGARLQLQNLYFLGSAPVTINSPSATSYLVKRGPGTMVISGNPSLSEFDVVAGKMQIRNPSPGASFGTVVVESGATLDLNTFNANVLALMGSGSVLLGPGTLTVNSGTFSGVISDTGTVTVPGMGDFVLTGTSTYTGPTTVGGIFEVDGSDVHSTITVNGGALRGSGNVGNVTLDNGGAITPGVVDVNDNATGMLSASNVTWNPGGMINMTLGAPGTVNTLAVAQNLQKGTSGAGTGYVFNFTAGITPNGDYAFTGRGSYSIMTFGSTNFSASDFTTTGAISGIFTMNGNTLQFTVLPTYAEWKTLHFLASDQNNAAISGPAATPHQDGVPNLLKFVCDISPDGAITATDREALPVLGTATVGTTDYLTLTFREIGDLSGVSVVGQVSSDMQTWQTVFPEMIGIDPSTDDPILRVRVPLVPGLKQFLRLDIAQP